MAENLAHGYPSRVLSESYLMNTNMAGFRWLSTISEILVRWMKVASALKGLSCMVLDHSASEAAPVKYTHLSYIRTTF